MKIKTLFHTQFIMAVFQSGIHLKFRLVLRLSRLSSPAPCTVGDIICVRLVSHIHTQGHVCVRSQEAHSDTIYYSFSDNLTIQVVQMTNLNQSSNFRQIELQEINLTFRIYCHSIAISSNRIINFVLWQYRQILCLVFLLYLASK